MKVEIFLPSAALTPFVREFLIIECDLDTDSRTIPDTSMVMAFQYKGRVSQTEAKDASLPITAIAGLRKTSRSFHYGKGTANLLAIFTPGGINAFSRMPAHELFERHVHAENIFPASVLYETLERLTEAATNRHRIDVIETFLTKQLVNEKTDPLVDESLKIIKQHDGILKIKDLALSLHISQDAFEKRFRTLIGATPKQYASIVRLRQLIKNYPSHTSLTDASYTAGYFDQSHFIKDFRLFTGQTPGDFFKSSNYW